MKTKHQILSILILILYLAASAIGYLNFRGNPQAQFIIVFLAVTVYVMWGIWHHWLEERVTFKVISEYFLLGILVILLFYFLSLVL